MKRRDFLKTGALSATLPFWMQYCKSVRAGYPITVHSDHQAGHLVMESQQWPVTKLDKTGIVIVGGGIAGLTAAHQLRNTDFQLFELSDRIGGTASAQPFEDIHFCQGAHYELAYPDYYGEEVLTLLESLDIIRYESWKKTWTFTDQKHIIPYHRRQQCFENGQLRKEVLKAGPLKDQFTQLLQPFHGHMTLPTRLIEDRFHHLNELTFHDYLRQHMTLDPAFKRQVDYHMLDDYGGTSEQVSALAGIHYFRCRPYYEQSVDLFSPPNGNDYFARKLSALLPSGSIHLDHLVASINYQNGSYQLQILDINNRRLLQLEAEQVIYAGQKARPPVHLP